MRRHVKPYADDEQGDGEVDQNNVLRVLCQQYGLGIEGIQCRDAQVVPER